MTAIANPKSKITVLDDLAGDLLQSYLGDERARRISQRYLPSREAIVEGKEGRFGSSEEFPPEYTGDGFAAEHGSWNRSKRTGYKVIRIRLRDGVPTGEYEDFVTGFVINDSDVWGRPVGVAVAHDGALLVSEDASGTIWRITY